MMGKRNMSIVFSSMISDIAERNSSFDSGVLSVCYTGRNRNNSFISKTTFERCMKSIYNCPVVCRYDRETDTIGAHDMELVSSDGGMRIVNMTHPVGVVPADADWWWEEREDASGIHEYLCVSVLLWKRQEAYRKIKEDGITDESMEISVKEGHMEDGVYVIDDFEFTAFCLLGSAEPCYEGASLEVFSHEDFKGQFADMMRELKETFTLEQPLKKDVIDNKKLSEGGSETLEEKIALMTQFGLNAEQLDFKLEDFTLDELKAKFEAMKENSPEETGEGAAEQNYALAQQFLENLIDALSAEQIETCFGQMSRYCYVDHNIEAAEVYCYDAEDWKLYGFPYSMNGDNVSIDFACKKKKKFAIVDFDEGEQTAVFASVFQRAAEAYDASNAQWEQKYQDAQQSAEKMQNELTELRSFKTSTEAEAVFARFEDLIGIEAFENLRGNTEGLSAEELEEKCFAIRGRNGVTAKFAHERAPKLPVEKADVKNEPYGGVFAEYGITPVKHN